MGRSIHLAIVVWLIIGISLTGCALRAQQQRSDELRNLLVPLVDKGATHEEIIQKLGAPQKRETFGSLEVWTYHMSYGQRGNFYVSPNDQYGTYGNARSYELFDLITLTFDANGRFKSFRTEVKR